MIRVSGAKTRDEETELTDCIFVVVFFGSRVLFVVVGRKERTTVVSGECCGRYLSRLPRLRPPCAAQRRGRLAGV